MVVFKNDNRLSLNDLNLNRFNRFTYLLVILREVKNKLKEQTLKEINKYNFQDIKKVNCLIFL